MPTELIEVNYDAVMRRTPNAILFVIERSEPPCGWTDSRCHAPAESHDARPAAFSRCPECRGQLLVDGVNIWCNGKPAVERWVPTSKIEDYTGELLDTEDIHTGPGSIFIPEWLATEKGLI